MVDGLVELIIYTVLWTAQGISILFDAKQRSKAKQDSSSRSQSRATLSQLSLISQYSRAVLISSSSINFGNACERLVNIAFQTSQNFPTMMRTCADINKYILRELRKQYPDEYFHIIIGDNHAFGFSVGNDQYFAEIEQEQYRVLIFAAKQHSYTKLDTHDVNDQMELKWN